ncbi:macro domain-containing protein [Candidatus Woesearchaeota archaeon]|nr:macro domain-containing protein [Candidatus Woesearchaeota archaeon]
MASEHNIGRAIVGIYLGNVLMQNADAIVVPVDTMLDYRSAPGSFQSAVEHGNHSSIFDEARQKAKSEFSAASIDSLVPMIVQPGSVHITSAGSLNARNVFHAVVIAHEMDAYDDHVMRTYSSAELVSKSTMASLQLANENGFRSIAFPLFGGSAYRLGLEEGAEAMAESFSEHLNSETTLERISLVVPWDLHYCMAKEVFEKKFH